MHCKPRRENSASAIMIFRYQVLLDLIFSGLRPVLLVGTKYLVSFFSVSFLYHTQKLSVFPNTHSEHLGGFKCFYFLCIFSEILALLPKPVSCLCEFHILSFLSLHFSWSPNAPFYRSFLPLPNPQCFLTIIHLEKYLLTNFWLYALVILVTGWCHSPSCLHLLITCLVTDPFFQSCFLALYFF
jgi:hypothetical protein